MYQEFFSLNKQPFSISPDPDFMFLSDRHKEALAHLTYGLQDNGGFVLLTGEVGTGKTTVCRALLQDMPKDVDIAFILNPALSEIELLATICDEFNIDYALNLKSIFDSLNGWMMNNLRSGRSAIVLIDEAQHLSFAALEQLRLLTNIESNKKKPLQVILIGQTELQQKLKQTELRQLAQRITARYHLLPLNQAESEYYIQHRLNVAGANYPLFQRNALQQIFKKSQGIPRLINLLCDRCLLSAYSEHATSVTPKMVSVAAKEIGVDGINESQRCHGKQGWRVPLLLILLSLLAVQTVNTFGYLMDNPAEDKRQSAEMITVNGYSEDKLQTKIQTQSKDAAEDSVDNQVEESNWFDNYPGLDLSKREFGHALTALYAVWGYQLDLQTVSCEQGAAASLLCLSDSLTLEKAALINYPAVIKLKNGDEYFYVVMYKIDNDYQLLIDDQVVQVSAAWLAKYWQGGATLLWKTPFEIQESLQFGQQNEKIAWLVTQLNNIYGLPKEDKDRFDLALLQKVSAFQQEHGLKEDGVVGVRTMMTLMQLTHPELPRLISEEN